MKEIDKKDATEISGGNLPCEPWGPTPTFPPPINDGPTFPDLTDDPRCIPPTFPDPDQPQY